MITIKNVKTGMIRNFNSTNESYEFIEKQNNPNHYIKINNYSTSSMQIKDEILICICKEKGAYWSRTYDKNDIMSKLEYDLLSLINGLVLADNDDVVNVSNKKIIKKLDDLKSKNLRYYTPYLDIINNLIKKKNISIIYVDEEYNESHKILRDYRGK